MTSRAAAVRYARALFDVARQEQVDLERLRGELTDFAALVSTHDSLQRTFSNPGIPVTKKRDVVDQLVARMPGASTPFLKLLRLLAERDRLVLLADIASAFDARLMEHRKVVRAELVTAIDLPADRIAEVRDGLGRATGREVHLETRVDPAIIGGAVARIGSTVYDGSLTRQLEKLKESLIESAQ